MRSSTVAAAALLAGCQLDIDIEANPEDDGYPTLSALDEGIIDRMLRWDIPGASACIVKDAEIAWCQGYGVADAETGRPVSTQTPFMIASISKTVVAIAAMQAIESGDLSLSDPIAGLIDHDLPDDAGEITIKHLLTHTAGIKDNWSVLEEDEVYGKDSPIALGDYLESYLSPAGSRYEPGHVRGHAPGEDWRYSNVGYALLAQGISAATGQDFAAYTQENIFTPLEMSSAAWFLADVEDVDALARPHAVQWGQAEALPHKGFPTWPDGQLRLTAPDLAKLVAALMAGGGPLLPSSRVAEMEAVYYPELGFGAWPLEHQGLGLFGFALDDEVLLGHGGTSEGIKSMFMYDPEAGIGLVLLTNGDGAGGLHPLKSSRQILSEMRAAASEL